MDNVAGVEVFNSANQVKRKCSGLVFIEFIWRMGYQVEESVLHVLKHQVNAFNAAVIINANPLLEENIEKFCSKDVCLLLVEKSVYGNLS